jgi:integral membrane protein (TIGR01906 family)
MRRAALTAVTVVVAVSVPLLLATTALRIVANDWIVSFEYDHAGVPADRYGLTRAERGELALLGLDAILPGGRGIELLEEARLPDGEAAFGPRELEHMQDVRDAVGIAFTVQLVTLLLVVVPLVALAWRPGTRRAAPRGIQIGSAATLAVAAAVGLLMLVAWDGFFVGFHEMFFEGDSWRFSRTDTLLRLYPDEFWVGVASWIAGLTVALAVVLLVATTLLLRRERRRAGP